LLAIYAIMDMLLLKRLPDRKSCHGEKDLAVQNIHYFCFVSLHAIAFYLRNKRPGTER
jgi:hypothetical protein